MEGFSLSLDIQKVINISSERNIVLCFVCGGKGMVSEREICVTCDGTGRLKTIEFSGIAVVPFSYRVDKENE